MLVIDDNKLRLARMQETLLRVSNENREENLAIYKKTVIAIDSQAFADIISQIECINEHNHTLEEELKYLEEIKKSYDQLLELQVSFKNVCADLELSDLSQLNIEYIEDRISVINGYLTNTKNIEINKVRLQELSERLVFEEKKKDTLSKRLLELESSLRATFDDAEGRWIIDGQQQYTSVLEEYKKLGYDLKLLLIDSDKLGQLLSDLNKEMTEVDEKAKTAEICYTNIPSMESKQILDEINNAALKVKYRLSMLRIVEQLSKDYDNYDDFINKRRIIVDLIKYRLSCLKGLGISVSFDPFDGTKVREQLSLSMEDNSKIISKIRKEISELSLRTEEMVKQNSKYLISLGDTKELLENKIGINDINVSSVELHIVSDAGGEEVLENQVVSIRKGSEKLNMRRIHEKTSSVINRVNQMINTNASVIDRASENDVYTPELVIESTPAKEEPVLFIDEMPNDVDSIVEVENTEAEEELNDTIFETVTPFLEAPKFVDRMDDSIFPVIDSESSLGKVDKLEDTEEMPDAFWVVQNDGGTDESVDEDKEEISFEDGLRLLGLDESSNVSKESSNNVKVLRKAA